MNISETPEMWVILKIPNEYYKVFGCWVGGYLGEDRWKINSGIKEVKEDSDFYYFIGFSGSCYKCNKKKYGINSSYGKSVLDSIIKKSEGQISLIDKNLNWVKLINNK